MKTYQELLKSEDWLAKRKEILLRDGHICQRCGHGKEKKIPTLADRSFLEELKISGPATFVERTFSSYIYLINNFYFKTVEEYSESKNYTLVVNFMTESSANPKGYFQDQRINQGFIKYLNMNKLSLFADCESIFLVPEIEIQEFTKSTLQIHHLCYRDDIEVGHEHPDELQTLCNICHRITHEYEVIKRFDSSGNDIGSMTPCFRCGGIGYISCYSHVRNGICFRCNGKRWENQTFIT